MLSLKDTIAKYGLNANKSLGQHFLLDQNLTDKIVVHAGGVEGINVIEIGPGPGGLTRSILRANPNHLYAIEKDARCVAALQELAEEFPGKLTIMEADALKTNVADLCPGPRKIIANLPYNVGTELLVHWLDEIAANASSFVSLTLMFQKEVAERIAAETRSKAYGRLSVFAQWLCEVHHLFDIPPGAFSPPPKVTSSVIHLIPRAHPLKVDKTAFEKTVAAGFNQRRKMLRASLKTLGSDTEALLTTAGIDGTRRAEELSVEEWVKLANAL